MRLQNDLGITFGCLPDSSSAAIMSTARVVENVAQYSKLCSVEVLAAKVGMNKIETEQYHTRQV